MKVVYPPELDRNAFNFEHATQLIYKEFGHLFIDKPILSSINCAAYWYRPGQDKCRYRRYDRLQHLVGKVARDIDHLHSCGARIASIEMVRMQIRTTEAGTKINDAEMTVRINLAQRPNLRQHSNCHHGVPRRMRELVEAAAR